MSHDESTPGGRLLGEIGGVLAVFFAAQLFAVIPVLIIAFSVGLEFDLANLQQDENFYLVAFGSFPIAMLGLLLFVRFLLHRRNLVWADIGLFRPVRWGQTWLQGLGLAFLILIVTSALGFVLEKLGFEQNLIAFDFLEGNTWAFIYMVTVVTWFAAAFVEEVVFRGFITNNLVGIFGRSDGGWIAAIIIQSLIFGGLHIYQGTLGVVLAITVGMIFGFAYWKLKNLWPVIIAHGLANTFGITLLYFGAENLV